VGIAASALAGDKARLKKRRIFSKGVAGLISSMAVRLLILTVTREERTFLIVPEQESTNASARPISMAAINLFMEGPQTLRYGNTT
jgi:hypothetical protein